MRLRRRGVSTAPQMAFSSSASAVEFGISDPFEDPAFMNLRRVPQRRARCRTWSQFTRRDDALDRHSERALVRVIIKGGMSFLMSFLLPVAVDPKQGTTPVTGFERISQPTRGPPCTHDGHHGATSGMGDHQASSCGLGACRLAPRRRLDAFRNSAGREASHRRDWAGCNST